MGSATTGPETIAEFTEKVIDRKLRRQHTALAIDPRNVTEMIQRAAAGRPTERTLAELQTIIERTTVNGATVADITMTSLGGPAPFDVTSQRSPWSNPEQAAPLWRAIGRQVRSVDALISPVWMPGDHAGSQGGEKLAFPTADFQIDAADLTVDTLGLVIDLSLWAQGVLTESGRGDEVANWLLSQAWRATESALFDELATATNSKATIGDAVDALGAPFAANVITGPPGELGKLDLVNVSMMGLRPVPSTLAGGMYVLAVEGVDAVYSEPLVMAEPEPERAGVVMSASIRHGIKFDNLAVCKVVPTP